MVTKTPKKTKKYRKDIGEYKGEKIPHKALSHQKSQRREVRELLRFCEELAEAT